MRLFFKAMLTKLRPRWGIATILTIGFVSVITLVMVVDVALDIRRERAASQANLEERGRLLATGLNDVLANYIYFSDVDALRDLAELVRSQPDVEYMRVLNREGRFLVTGPRDDGQNDYATGFASDQFVLQVLQEGQTSLRFIDDALEVASPITAGREVLGVVEFGFNADALRAEIRALVLQDIWQGALLAVIGILLAYFVAQYFARPIRRLAAATTKFGMGELEFTINSNRSDEIGELTRSFSLMAARIQERTAELAQVNEAMALADEVARIITSTLDIDQVYEKFALELKKLVYFDRLHINTIDHGAGVFTVKYLVGEVRPGRPPGRSKPLEGSRTQHVMETAKTLVQSYITGESRFPGDLDDAKAGLRSGILVPLITKGQVVGAITARSREANVYGPREQAILERLASQIAPALENARLYEETQAEKERTAATLAQLEAVLETAGEGIVAADSSGKIVMVNEAVQDIWGYGAEELIGESLECLIPEKYRPAHRAGFERYSQTGVSSVLGKRLELEGVRKDGSIFPLEIHITEANIGERVLFTAAVRDITDRKHLEEQLSQAQKMEIVGQLAGGVAHDFNNLLTAIMGYSQMSLKAAPPGSPMSSHLEEVMKASERAANLTGQLLSFSRRQVIEPKVIDLNDLIINTDKMLRRLIGDDIELVTLPANDLGLVKADPGQIEQVLMNLAVNARDAMPKGGKLSIETANVTLDAEYARQHGDASPVRHVMLAVSDTGMGMSEEVQEHIFEPFFTTKEVGKGTGLGLATCYGIVQQSGGHIEVSSEPGRGASFKVYLPVTEETYAAQPKMVDSSISPQGKETVLLAEDEPLVRSMVATVLRNQGYMVLEASNGEEALRMVQKHGGEGIELLLTDVVMPQMGGPELAEQLRATHPGIKVLFTSGYVGDSVSEHGNLPTGTEFLAKPYMPDALAVKVREVLDQQAD